MSAPSKSRRQSELAKIHIGAKQLLGDDREAYRDMVEEVTGKRSAGDLDAAGRRRLLEHLESRGAKFGPARKSGLKRNPPKPPPDTEPQIRKVRAMLAEAKLPEAYAEAILQRQCSHPHRVPLQWANGEQLRGVIAALANRQKRIEKRAAAEAGQAS